MGTAGCEVLNRNKTQMVFSLLPQSGIVAGSCVSVDSSAIPATFESMLPKSLNVGSVSVKGGQTCGDLGMTSRWKYAHKNLNIENTSVDVYVPLKNVSKVVALVKSWKGDMSK